MPPSRPRVNHQARSLHLWDFLSEVFSQEAFDPLYLTQKKFP